VAQQPFTTKEKFFGEPLARSQELSVLSVAPDKAGKAAAESHSGHFCTNGLCLAWDFTCPDTLAPSHLNNSVNGSGIAACPAEDKKRTKYANLATSFCFVPVAMETLGALGAGAIKLLLALGRRITESTGERRATE